MVGAILTSTSATIRHSTVNKGTLLRYSSIYHRLYNNPSYSRSHIENAIYTENVASLIATRFLPNCTPTQKNSPDTREMFAVFQLQQEILTPVHNHIDNVIHTENVCCFLMQQII